MTALSVDIQSKCFGSHQVLGPMAFEIAAGERVALLGPSGIGKSTLMGLIAGTDPVFDGRVSRPNGQIAMVFQTPRLLPWRTLVQNIALIPDAGGEPTARARLAEVGLADAADQYPEKVSLGMQRRAALARALAVEPSVILMDEPLVSLDPASAQAMRGLLTEALDRTGASALIATHNRAEALALCDRVLELDGPPATLRKDRASPLDRTRRADAAAVDALCREWYGDVR
ncbi:MAG: ATP-binding cassette domain-containing protein [Pseudomonadota bacterium]